MFPRVVVVRGVVYIDRSEPAVPEMELRFPAKKLYHSVPDWLETHDVESRTEVRLYGAFKSLGIMGETIFATWESSSCHERHLMTLLWLYFRSAAGPDVERSLSGTRLSVSVITAVSLNNVWLQAAGHGHQYPTATVNIVLRQR